MNPIFEDLQIVINRELDSLRNEVKLFPDDTTLWQVLPGITNSAGNLVLHVCGNLKYYIGSVLGNTGYLRDRESEFKKNSTSRAELDSDLENTIMIIKRVLPQLSETILTETYPETVGGFELPCGRFLIHLATHLSFHVGQVGYLRRILTGDNKSSGAVSLRILSGQI